MDEHIQKERSQSGDRLSTPRHMMRKCGWSVHMGKKARVCLTLDGDLCHTGCSLLDFIS